MIWRSSAPILMFSPSVSKCRQNAAKAHSACRSVLANAASDGPTEFTHERKAMSTLSSSRATAVATSSGDLIPSAGEHGKSTSSWPAHGHFDACPTWLELAIRHLSDAQVGQVSRDIAGSGTDNNAKTGALEWEFETSMQAIVASANAVDAFCAAVQARVFAPQLHIDEGRDKRVPRNVQIAEVLSRALSLTPKDANSLRRNLGEIFRFRDLSIDPTGKMDAQILHPVLGVGVEWRFAYFRYENALLIVQATLRIIGELVASGGPMDAEIQRYIDELRSRIEPLRKLKVLQTQTVATDTYLVSKPNLTLR